MNFILECYLATYMNRGCLRNGEKIISTQSSRMVDCMQAQVLQSLILTVW